MVQFAENRVCVLSPLDEFNDVRFLVDDFESDFSNQSNEILFDMLGPPSMGTIFQRIAWDHCLAHIVQKEFYVSCFILFRFLHISLSRIVGIWNMNTLTSQRSIKWKQFPIVSHPTIFLKGKSRTNTIQMYKVNAIHFTWIVRTKCLRATSSPFQWNTSKNAYYVKPQAMRVHQLCEWERRWRSQHRQCRDVTIP